MAAVSCRLPLALRFPAQRSIHASSAKGLKPSSSSKESLLANQNAMPAFPPPAPSPTEDEAPLAVLPLYMILRSLFITSVTSSPILLPPSLAAMSLLAHSTNPLLNPDHNPLLRWIMKKTLYAQFCAGETPDEVAATIGRLKGIGFTGVILGYAREVVLTEEQTRELASCGQGEAAEACIRDEITPWAAGTKETVRLASPGDFVALKYVFMMPVLALGRCLIP